MATATSSTNSKKQLTTTQISDNKPDAFEGTPSFSVPGLTLEEGSDTAAVLQRILNTYNDLHLTLKHVHWNVVGPNFISVHQMIDPQVETIRGYADDVAERIATLGSSPQGTPGALVEQRDWDDYSIGRAGAIEHLAALDAVYIGVITSIRKAATETEELDDVTNDLLIGHLHEIEQFHWFVRAHLENAGGVLSTAGETSEKGSAKSATS